MINSPEGLSQLHLGERVVSASDLCVTSQLKKRSSFSRANPNNTFQDFFQIEELPSPIAPRPSQEQDPALDYYRSLNIQLFKVNTDKEIADSEQQSPPCLLMSQLADTMSNLTQRITGLTLLDGYVLTPGNKTGQVTLEFKSQMLCCVTFRQSDSKLLTASVKISKDDQAKVCMFLMVQRQPTSPMPKPVTLLIKSTPSILKGIFKSINRIQSEKELAAELIRLQTSSLSKGAIRIQLIHKSENFKRGELANQHKLRVSDFTIQSISK